MPIVSIGVAISKESIVYYITSGARTVRTSVVRGGLGLGLVRIRQVGIMAPPDPDLSVLLFVRKEPAPRRVCVNTSETERKMGTEGHLETRRAGDQEAV